MAMRTTPNNFTIADYADQIRNKQIVVNHNYQRTDKVWPISAKSNLIDTVLNGYPIPKLILSQTTDLDTRKTRKEVVDGQQRTAAINEFLDNKYVLTRGDYKGSRFDDLDPEKKRDFLDYTLSADMFSSATEDEIREVFRRINSYQVPLNKQETRHATHQGEFKWFVREMGRKYASSLVKMGVINEKGISRMADLELLTEFCSLIGAGIKTASATTLDKLYDEFDENFPETARYGGQLDFCLGFIIAMPEIHNTNLMSKGNFYSLFAAVLAAGFPDAVCRVDLLTDHNNPFAPEADIARNLLDLSEEIELGGVVDHFKPFVAATKQGTNTRTNRLTRFRYFHQALVA